MIKFIKRCKKVIKALREHLSDVDGKTYYLEERRKSKWSIYFDNIMWIIRYHEINHHYFLYGFDRKNGVDFDDYIRYQPFFNFRNKANATVKVGGRKSDYLCISADKFLFGQYLKSLDFPTPRLLAVLDNKSITWLEPCTTMSFDSLLQKGNLDCFIKKLVGGHGEGVYPLRVQDGKIILNDEEITLSQLKEKIKERYIIEERVYQHSWVNAIYPHSVNTVRIVTAASNNGVVLLSAAMRIGARGNKCDNWSAGGLAIGVNLETGKLKKYGFLRPDFGRKVEKHPNTGFVFENFQIPYFFEAVSLAKELHNYFYGLHSIGWDVAITADGPVFIESNDAWGLRMIQVNDNEIKKKFLASLPFEVDRKKFKL